MNDADAELNIQPTRSESPAVAEETTEASAAAESEGHAESAEPKKAVVKRAAAKKTVATRATAKKTVAKRTTAKKTVAKPTDTDPAATAPPEPAERDENAAAPAAPEPASTPVAAASALLFQAPDLPAEAERAAKKTSRSRRAAIPAEPDASADDGGEDAATTGDEEAKPTRGRGRGGSRSTSAPAAEASKDTSKSSARDSAAEAGPDDDPDQGEHSEDDDAEDSGSRRRPRRRGGRRRRRSDDDTSEDSSDEGTESDDTDDSDESGDVDGSDAGDGSSKRRRTRVRKPRNPEDEITAVSGSTRLEAKRQRRREGREAGRRRAPIVSEAEFLARREAVDRVMVIRQRDELTQIAVLEDKVLVEHYVSRESQTSLIGNIYLGRVQNVLPSMEAAFIDIGKGRNAVLYAGEVNWKGLGHPEGEPRKIESVLKSGQSVLVQVTKDPVGQKGARLTGQISLPGRFLVFVPDGTTSGISRKLPDTERTRLKNLLKQIVPDSAGVIVRTAAEGASEDELTRDVERLTARWGDIESKIGGGRAPQLLYGEPDLTLKVVRDLFTEDFARLVVEGEDAWDLVEGYVSHVAPDLQDRLERFEPADDDRDVFAAYRIDEQIAKALDRKVWLPSGGSLIIERTEAMTVVDVNTGKFTGSGGNLEETVTKNNLEAAEEVVRQLRLRDIGGIIVIDFIDMVLESNRDLVLRRLVECLGRDRTRHQVAEVTSLGLVQMTRKRIGTGLVEAFSNECEHCKGRGVIVHEHPIEPPANRSDEGRNRRGRGGRSRGGKGGDSSSSSAAASSSRSGPSPAAAAAAAVAAASASSKHDADPGAEAAADTDAGIDDVAADVADTDSAEPKAAKPTKAGTTAKTVKTAKPDRTDKADRAAEPAEPAAEQSDTATTSADGAAAEPTAGAGEAADGERPRRRTRATRTVRATTVVPPPTDGSHPSEDAEGADPSGEPAKEPTRAPRATARAATRRTTPTGSAAGDTDAEAETDPTLAPTRAPRTTRTVRATAVVAAPTAAPSDDTGEALAKAGDDASASPGSAEDADIDATLLQVPVKRKGSRKK